MSFDQLRLDSSIPIGVEELAKTKQKLEELETLVKHYEEREIEHKDLETHMKASYAIFIREAQEAKQALALADIRNQELKEENVRMNAQLSGRIDVLLNERNQYSQFFEQEFWCEIPRYQFVQMSFYCNHYKKLRVRVDLENHVTSCVQPYEPIVVSEANA